MGLKSYIRERLIAAVQYAVREEMKNERLISENREIPNGENSSEEIINRLDKQIERWTWERYKRSEDKLLYVYKLQNQISELLFQEKKVPYIKGEKIRIVFLFQVASFWP